MANARTSVQDACEFLTLDELIDEIEKRTTAFILIFTHDPKNEPDKSLFRCSWKGGNATAYGLAHYGMLCADIELQRMAQSHQERCNPFEENGEEG